MFRKADMNDLSRIVEIYNELHTAEELGKAVIGWVRNIYPVEETAKTAIELGEMFVETAGGTIVASGKINREQVDVYAKIPWKFPAEDSEVMVLHTLTVSPSFSGKGYGTKFVEFYEEYASNNGAKALRIDTNQKNASARKLYKRLGYREAGIEPCNFYGIKGIQLVCLEKQVK